MAYNTFVPNGSSRAIESTRSAFVSPSFLPPDDPVATAQATGSYEWLDYGTFVPGQGTTRWETNPPFTGMEAGRLLPGMNEKDSQGNLRPAAIVRGYIRRAQYNVADRASKCRLYFMYNPETITRQYVNYLDQGALDPFNTVYQSGNLVAPPSIMDFNFELFFDRQHEARIAGNRGVLVDMDYFDMVVRNVIPQQSSSNNALPDNGLMMVNPRDITVVFSKELTVQGRPLNAQIVYEKFTHRMTPTRMRIALTMRVVYIGPVRDLTPFVAEEVAVERRIPFDIQEPQRYDFSFNKLEWASNDEEFSLPNTGQDVLTLQNGKNGAGAQALTIAFNRTMNGGFKAEYDKGRRNQLWKYSDCSSLVWGGFADNRSPDGTGDNNAAPNDAQMSMAEKLGWSKWSTGISGGGIASTRDMLGTFQIHPLASRLFGFDENETHDSAGRFRLIMGDDTAKEGTLEHDGFQYGDILLRVGVNGKSDHVAFFYGKTESKQGFEVFHASDPDHDVTKSTYSSASDVTYNYGIRINFLMTPEGDVKDAAETVATVED